MISSKFQELQEIIHYLKLLESHLLYLVMMVIQVITYDANSSNLPVGGVIVSVGSSAGFGYQPLVSAGGTATVSTAGTISAVTIGSRFWIQIC